MRARRSARGGKPRDRRSAAGRAGGVSSKLAEKRETRARQGHRWRRGQNFFKNDAPASPLDPKTITRAARYTKPCEICGLDHRIFFKEGSNFDKE